MPKVLAEILKVLATLGKKEESFCCSTFLEYNIKKKLNYVLIFSLSEVIPKRF
jgi:hypothetical protein